MCFDCLYDFSRNFFILSNERHMIKNEYRSSHEVPFILVTF